MKNKYIIALVFFISFTTNTYASLITMERINFSGSTNLNAPGTDLQNFWNVYANLNNILITPDIGEATLIFNGAGNNNTLYKMSINFSIGSIKEIDFYAGLDAQYGAEVYLNNTSIYDTTNNLWWARKWQNTDVIAIENIDLALGNNVLEFFWAEGRNSGGNSFQISETSLGRVALSSDSLAAAVPEPRNIILFALLLLGLVFLRRNNILN
jgi:hypothetical protein